MLNFIFGVGVGIAVATVGFSGIANWADKGVHEVQHQVIKIAK